MTSIAFLVLGLVLLTLGGEFLVKAASKVAAFMGISPLVIGLTVVACGTSAPELGVSLFAALEGNPEIALSNVVGSNIFNIGFILGLCALLSPLVVDLKLIKLDVPILIGASILTYLFAYDGEISRMEGVLLIAGAVGYVLWLIRASKKESKEIKEEFGSSLKSPSKKELYLNSLYIVLSLGLLIAGSKFLVSGAVDIAKLLNVSDSLIGLTIVAAGTSLPEVATSVMATLRGQKDIAIGNVIGSNIFNIFLILGLSVSASSGLGVTESLIRFDLLVMVGVAALCYPMLVTSKKLVRWEGAVLFLSYVAYTAFLIHRG